MRNTFKAYERLKREQHIDTLFRNGKAFSFFPVKFVFHTVPRPAKAAPVQVGFSVPKKKFKLSVHRHRVRRQMFEAWRLHKQALYEAVPQDAQLHIFLLFQDNKLPDYEPVQQAVVSGITRLVKQLTPAPHA